MKNKYWIWIIIAIVLILLATAITLYYTGAIDQLATIPGGPSTSSSSSGGSPAIILSILR